MTTVLDNSATLNGTDDGDGDSNLNARIVIKSAILGAATGDQVRLILRWGSVAGSGGLDACYVGQAAASGNAYKFNGNQRHVLFAGSGSASFAQGADTVSDWITLGETYDNTKNYVVSFHINSVGSPSVCYAAVANRDLYFDGTGASSASTDDATLGSSDLGKGWLVSKIEIQASGGGGSPVLRATPRMTIRRKRPDFSGWNPIRDHRTRSQLILPDRNLILPRGFRKAA